MPTNNTFPETPAEASELLKRGYVPVGGGTDLLVRNHAFKKSGTLSGIESELKLFSCREIAETCNIELNVGRLTIGSSITLDEIIKYPGTPELLKQSLLSIASPGIRNTATLAGNICNASPAADSLPALYVLDAAITLAGAGAGAGAGVGAEAGSVSEGNTSYRTIPISDFITGPGKTAIRLKEIVVSISLPASETDDCKSYYRKVGTRAANALSKLSVAAVWKNSDGFVTDFRLAAGACAPTVVRSIEAESLINGKDAEQLSIAADEVIKIYEPLLNPIDDQRSTARYRKNTVLKIIRGIIEGI